MAPPVWLRPGILLLLTVAAAASDASCPAPCVCEGRMLDCSRRRLGRLPAAPLPEGITSLEISHNWLTLSNSSLVPELYSLQEVKMNYNELTAIPHLGEPTANITLLSLVHNKISELNGDLLQQFLSLETLDLSSNLLTEIKSTFFPRIPLKHLNLSNNRITTLEVGSFDNLSGSLIVLKLNRNKLSAITPKSLKLPNLQHLELRRNRIQIVESLTFQGLDSLKSLKMQRNGIGKLMDGAFFGLDSMEQLELEYNNVTDINKGWLYGLRSLQQLYMSQNAINRISPDAWEFCQNLLDLDLSYNQINRLDEFAFVGLASLEKLNLGDNRINHIAEGVFKGLATLLTLDLRNNEISWAIEDSTEAFAGLSKLHTLVLQGNKIKSITKKAFTGLDSLQNLDLSNNGVMSLQDDAFAHINLQELILNTSNLLCDCQLKWFPQWLIDHGLQNSVNVSCAHPDWLSGRSLLSVDSGDFVCDNYPKPQIKVHPETTVALKGMNVTLTCAAVSSSDTPMSTAWRKDSEILYDGKVETFARYQKHGAELVEYTTVLHLFNVNFTDEGKYQCVITNHFGSNYSSKAKLTVNEMPSFLKTPMDLTIRTGAMARLECAAEGHPTPQIAWQKDGGTDFPAARERRMHVMPEDEVLFIVNVKIEDMGLYSCSAQNAAGSISTNVTLTVLETPTFMRPLEDRTVARGETAVLQCIAGGSPAPRLNWTKDDGPLMVTERHFFAAANQLLIIVDAGPEDAGKYTCSMSNTLGTERGHINLYVLSSPNCDSSQTIMGYDEDGWTTVGIVIIVVVCCVVGTSLVWVIVIYHMRRKSEDYSITNTEDMNLPADIPSYLSSQGTLSEPPEGYSNSEAGSHQQLMPPASSCVHKGTDGLYVDTGSEADAEILNLQYASNLQNGRIQQLYGRGNSSHPVDRRDSLPVPGAGQLMICSDCYDNANIYSRTREFCPYTYITEEDPMDHTLANLIALIPKDIFPHHSHDMATSAADMSAFLTSYDRKDCESFPCPSWSIKKDDGLPAAHPHFCHHPVPVHENSLLRNEVASSVKAEERPRPRPCTRSCDQDYDLGRTPNIGDYKETT
ncbi:leucine-rich repeats and immunoglobulin-like domains protein 2 [Bufo gargarizans]|uniref:leucine-rich repeats and immunoglobulin-like domains protein 2 n=1 Tax=Bufo gargarizans TaxID=30331 RepID=UPI001CF4D643|nr:leucine-rich repeats and immunoglobulin-like domains protein 2 [Bufo gargarizans]